MKKTISLLLLLALIIVSLSGCSFNKEYVIAVNDSFPPFSYLNNDGELEGFEVELIRMICETENINIRIVPLGIVDCIEALEKGEVDGVMASLLKTDEFNEKFDFSDIYYDEYAFAVLKGKKPELIDKFNAGLKRLIKSGKYDDLCSRYMLTGAEQ